MYCQLHDVRRVLGVELPLAEAVRAELSGRCSEEVIKRQLATRNTQEKAEAAIGKAAEEIHAILAARGYTTLPIPATSPCAQRIVAELQAQLVAAQLNNDKGEMEKLAQVIKTVHLLDAPESAQVEAVKEPVKAEKQKPPKKGSKKDGEQTPEDPSQNKGEA